MAKTKKTTQKSVLRKIENGQVVKHNFVSRIRDCVVNLQRLSKSEYEFYSNPSKTITKSFSIKLSGNTAEINNKKYHSNNKTFTFAIKKHQSEIILECCNYVPVLRKRCLAEMPMPKAMPKSVPKAVAKSLTAIINDAWKKCKTQFKSSDEIIEQNALVMAKMSGYSAWPSRINEFTKNGKRAHVYFFGSNNTGTVDVTEIVPFESCHEVIRLLLMRKLGQFLRGILEIERILGVPDELSLTKELYSIENN